jgi:hypothetical protein
MVRKHTSGTHSAVREHHRVSTEFAVRCEVHGGGTVMGVARDLSLGGAFIESNTIVAFGTPVTLFLRAKASGPDLVFPGVARWSNDRGFGMQFGLIGARETHDLIKLLAELRQNATPDGGRASGF